MGTHQGSVRTEERQLAAYPVDCTPLWREGTYMRNGHVHCHVPPLIFSGWSQHSLRSDKDSGAEREESPMPPGDTDYVVLKDDDSGTQL